MILSSDPRNTEDCHPSDGLLMRMGQIGSTPVTTPGVGTDQGERVDGLH